MVGIWPQKVPIQFLAIGIESVRKYCHFRAVQLTGKRYALKRKSTSFLKKPVPFNCCLKYIYFNILLSFLALSRCILTVGRFSLAKARRSGSCWFFAAFS
jgi:hypothetical protein